MGQAPTTPFLLRLVLLKKRNIEGGRIRVQHANRTQMQMQRQRERDICQLRPPGVAMMIEGRRVIR
jgi:hypothetical protein